VFDLITLQFLPGPLFLLAYLAAAYGCFQLAGSWARQLAETSSGRSSSQPLTTYHLALLKGDRRRALLAALVRLESVGSLKIDVEAKPPTLIRVGDPRVDDPFESVILASLDRAISLAHLTQMPSVDGRLDLLEHELDEQNLLVPKRAKAEHAARLAWIYVPLFSVGLLRMLIGLSAGRPVGFLLISLVIMSFIAAATLVGPRLNSRGQKLVEDYESRNAALKSSAESSAKGRMASEDLALAMALFGTSALATTLLPAAGSSGSCSSSCGSSCGGGCGGGCGGCGG